MKRLVAPLLLLWLASLAMGEGDLCRFKPLSEESREELEVADTAGAGDAEECRQRALTDDDYEAYTFGGGDCELFRSPHYFWGDTEYTSYCADGGESRRPLRINEVETVDGLGDVFDCQYECRIRKSGSSDFGCHYYVFAGGRCILYRIHQDVSGGEDLIECNTCWLY